MAKIINITYVKSDLNQVADNATQSNAEERTLLLSLLEDFQYLFDGTLGNWSTEPVKLELNPDSKPFNSIYYPVTIINKEKLQKELKILVEIGVLTLVHHIQYDTPVFIIPKKEGTVRFITEHHRINQKLVRKPYILPRIGETMQKLEVFQYVTALYLNMGYYTIIISPAIQDMTTIFTEFGEFIYNRLPMGMCTLG